ncbi:MAG: metal-dependent hydrolase, partial [Planctomycetia bacterium]|nr:metal-dependent hydrolase [Planctomycetia bacterium]
GEDRVVPGFRVHITGSSIVGAGYGAAAWLVGGMPPLTCALGGGLCAVAGMLPDLDSGPGIPLRESVAFAAAVVPIMLIHRMHEAGLPLEATILAGAAIYLAIRFGLSWLLKNYSHHRGMFHSLPAAAIAGQVAFLAFAAEEPLHRYFVSSAVVLGFMTHLVLDEIWSVKMGWFGPKVKKSFGTAMKFVGPDLWPNLLAYAIALVLGAMAAGDAAWTERMALVKQHTAAMQKQMQQQATRVYQQPQPMPWQYRR